MQSPNEIEKENPSGMKSKIITDVLSMTLNCFALNIRASTRRGWITNKSELESGMNP
jgi:hypothetical protein